MSLLSPASSNYIEVRDLTSATSWYMEKLGLRRVPIKVDGAENCVALGFSQEAPAIVLGPPYDGPSDELTNMLYASRIKKARDFLLSRGVNVGDIQQDRQGTRYFEMRDLEGNVIEISEVP